MAAGPNSYTTDSHSSLDKKQGVIFLSTDINDAENNYNLLQSALNKAGTIEIGNESGSLIYISSSLEYVSNTKLIIPKGVTLKATGTGTAITPLLVSASYNGTGIYKRNTITSLVYNSSSAYSAGTTYAKGDVVSNSSVYYLCIAATTGNTPPNSSYWLPISRSGVCLATLSSASDFLTKEWLVINGSMSAMYNGVHQAIVIDQTHIAYVVSAPPSDATATVDSRTNQLKSGAITIQRATVNCEFENLNIDKNSIGTGNTHGTVGIIHFGCYNLKEKGVSSIGAPKYGTMIANVRNWNRENDTTVNLSDGLHIYGPMLGQSSLRDSVICSINDDAIAIQANESSVYSYMDCSSGDILGFKIDNVKGESPNAVFALYNSDAAGFKMDVTFDNIDHVANPQGTKPVGDLIRGFDVVGSVAKLGHIRIGKIIGKSIAGYSINLYRCAIDSITIDKAIIDKYDNTSTAGFMSFGTGSNLATCKSFEMRDFISLLANPGSSTYVMGTLPTITGKAKFGSIHMEAAASNQYIKCLNIIGTYTEIDFGTVYATDTGNSGATFFAISAGATGNQINFGQVRVGSCYLLMSCAESANINFGQMRVNAGHWIQGASGKTINITGGAIAENSSYPFIVNSGTINLKSFNLEVDLNQAQNSTLSKSLGNFCWHKGATNPGLAYASGTQWLRVGDNAVIL